MLDSETRRRIDSCRDMLVGKVPDPKSQVEQITVALIYKFMDDMDATAEELGGRRSFFAGDFAKYGWAKLLSPTLGGHDMLALYSDAIQTMTANPGIPALFRDIFKNAVLPYRDPETLRAFLKEINGFRYDHSERLGDAFEYLLSVLGSQGDAGQFRTPRHIIDFIVDVVAPGKTDTVLDPACGTAGFLIAAYKHVLNANKRDRPGDLLSPDERSRLVQNLAGYDISPDMVRLSLVNLYLHGFPDPHIEEYDTLTSDAKWNKYADVILANPPFMSPKGGIKPHGRFSVQSNRSEVLFVDYIAEHLSPNGRAGVIVPEGVIFQSGGAYKSLREMLVKNYLVAVVSLPAGVFQPYSGVKTSVLIMDRKLAKQSEGILFVKIASDGFGLGAQRRAISQNDLPEAAKLLKAWTAGLRAGTPFDTSTIPNAHVVAKAKIAATSDYNLSGDRYKTNATGISDFPFVALGEVAEFINGFPFKPEDWNASGKEIIRIQNLTGTSKSINRTLRSDVPERNFVKRGDLLISWSATIGFYIWQGEDAYLNQHIFRVDTNSTIDKTYLYYLGNRISAEILNEVHGNTMQHVTKGRFEAIKIPLPPLDVQKEIVAEIEGYQKIIDGARQVVENYKPRIPISPDWPMVELSQVCELITKGTTPTSYGYQFQSSGIRFIKIENINSVGTISSQKMSYISDECHRQLERSQLKANDVLFSIAGTRMGITAFVDDGSIPANTNQALAIIRIKQCLLPKFAFYYLRSQTIQSEIERLKVGVAQFNLSLKQLTFRLSQSSCLCYCRLYCRLWSCFWPCRSLCRWLPS